MSVSVSVATAWELEIKRQSGKLTFDFAAWRDVSSAQVEILSIELTDAIEAARLPLHHRDPFDRIIIAQAINRGLTVVTSDRVFDRYRVPLLHV